MRNSSSCGDLFGSVGTLMGPADWLGRIKYHSSGLRLLFIPGYGISSDEILTLSKNPKIYQLYEIFFKRQKAPILCIMNQQVNLNRIFQFNLGDDFGVAIAFSLRSWKCLSARTSGERFPPSAGRDQRRRRQRFPTAQAWNFFQILRSRCQ